MKKTTAVDPGIRGCGVGEFDDGVLSRAAYVESPAERGNTAEACREMAQAVADVFVPPDDLALEWPRVYATRIREGKTKANPNDLLALCGVDAAIASLLHPLTTTCYAPSDWKGQMKKAPCMARIRSRLSPPELKVAEAACKEAGKTLAHNVWDAIGIGLHHLGRLGVRRVIA